MNHHLSFSVFSMTPFFSVCNALVSWWVIFAIALVAEENQEADIVIQAVQDLLPNLSDRSFPFLPSLSFAHI